MPIDDKDEYLIKTKTANEGYRLVGSVFMGNYGPQVSLVNCKLLRDALATVPDGKRVYFPAYPHTKKEEEAVVEKAPESAVNKVDAELDDEVPF